MSGHTPWSEIRRKRWQRSRTLFDDLATAVRLSRKSLDKIGEGDWTPQDSAHLHLVSMVEKFLADPPVLRTGRIIHGDAE